ncbi:MAG TPA: amidohydrolase family protein [Actinomycetota bacterium]
MIDQHCHPFSMEGGPLELSALTLDIRDDEGAVRRRATQGPMRAMQELLSVRLGARLGCDPEEVPQARAEASADYPAYVRSLFADAGITTLVMDVGFAGQDAPTWKRCGELSGTRVFPIHRIDPGIDAMMGEGASVDEILDGTLEAMRDAARNGFVGFKTAIAYRTGLHVDPAASRDAAERSLRDDVPVRRRGKACRDRVLRQALGVAAELGLPFQIHTGFGDSDIRLAESNPLLLEELLRTPEGQSARIVLIHGAYPWHEELGFLALTKPNVYAEISLFNLFAPLTVAQRLLTMVDLVPAGKLLAGTDGHAQPELFWFGALVLQEAWERIAPILGSAGARDGWIERVRRSFFEDTARDLYGIEEADASA